MPSSLHAVHVDRQPVEAVHPDPLSGRERLVGVSASELAADEHEPAGAVVARLDRLSRSMIDFASLMATAQRQGCGVIALDVQVDTSTASGEAMANMLATFAQFERRLIGQRTCEALAAKRAAGVRLGRPPTVPQPVASH